MVFRASARRTRQDNLTSLGSRISLDNDSVNLGGALKIVLARDRQLFGIGACLNLNIVAWGCCIDSGLNGAEAGRLSAAGWIGAVDVKGCGLLLGRNR